ncbi:MAG: PAS domain S-box protein [Spirochaetales bacterium]|nr:PAS domain S-box protein [Spirochaetales bacterium]
MIKKEHIESKKHHTSLCNPYFWIIIVLFLVVIILHYPHLHLIPVKIEINSYLGLERHALERILLLIPISLASYIFGLRGGVISLFTALIIMIPRVVALSTHKKDASFETVLTIAIGLLINWWLLSRRKEIDLREQALTKLEEKKHELHKMGKRFQEIFEKAYDAIWIQNESGHIISANLATALLTGYTLQELNNSNISRFLKPEAIQKAQDLEIKLINGINVHQPYELEIKKRNGEEAILMITTSLLGNETTPVFLKIARDITDEKKMQAHLRLYADQIHTAYEEERKRIARELHDDTIQTLVSISRSLDNYITKLDCKEKKISEPLDNINNSIDDALIRIRRFVHDLRPPTLEYLGLIPALRELVHEARDQSTIEINLSFTTTQFPFTREQELLIYRIIQEALSNIRKHSHATKADISLLAKGKEIMVEVKDDGQGFEIINGPMFLEKGKLGLMGMKERSHLLGGTLDISSKPGKGTTITLHL